MCTFCCLKCMLFTLTVIIVIPATRRASESPAAKPYSLVGAPKSQLVALTVTALKSHLQHYRLPTTGKKAALIDHLYNHICSLSKGAAGSNPTASTHGSQAGNPTTQSMTSSAQSTHSTTQSANPSTLPLPQQLVDQLIAYLQQYQTPTVGIQASNSRNITDDDTCLCIRANSYHCLGASSSGNFITCCNIIYHFLV